MKRMKKNFIAVITILFVLSGCKVVNPLEKKVEDVTVKYVVVPESEKKSAVEALKHRENGEQGQEETTTAPEENPALQ